MDSLSLLLAICLLLLLSAFFSGSETSLLSTSPLKIFHAERNQGQRYRYMATLIRNREWVIILLLVGNNLVATVYSMTGEKLLQNLFPSFSTGLTATLISALVLTPILVIFGEIFPKALFKQYSFTLLSICIHPLYALYNLSKIFRFILPWKSGTQASFDHRLRFNRDNLGHLLEVSTQSGGITEAQEELVRKLLILDEIPLRQRMQKFNSQHVLDGNMKTENLISQLRNKLNTPIWVKNQGQIDSYLPIHSLSKANSAKNTVKDLCEPLRALSIQTPTGRALKALLRSQKHFLLIRQGGEVIGYLSLSSFLQDPKLTAA